MIRLLLVLAMVCFAAGVSAQQRIAFRFDRPVPGVVVPHYSFEVHEDGDTSYRAEVVTSGMAELQPVEKTFMLAPATVRRALDAVASLRTSGSPCAAKMKNIADTGTKTVVYKGPQGETACSFNYTENKGAVQLADLFQGIELTLESGRALVFKRRFDRLGLDAEMASLSAQVEDGRAQGLEAIAPTLRSIAADTELIDRVRVRAGKLLERIDSSAQKAQ